VLRRALKYHCGYVLQEVVNYTDVDDKTIAGAQKAGMEQDTPDHGKIKSEDVIWLKPYLRRFSSADGTKWLDKAELRPFGYLGQLFTMPLPLALLGCLATPAWWSLILPVTLFVRALAAYTISKKVLGARINWWLLPMEDLLGFCFWIGGFFGNTISWRGRRYELYPDGRFELLPSSPANK